MRLPGMHYQDSTWPDIRKAVSGVILQALLATDKREQLADATDLHARWSQQLIWSTHAALTRRTRRWDKAPRVPCNQFGMPCSELAENLLSATLQFKDEETELPRFLKRLADKLRRLQAPWAEAPLRNAVNQCLGELRNHIDVQGFIAAVGEDPADPMSVTRLDMLRAVHAARSDLLRFLGTNDLPHFIQQITGIAQAGNVVPLEVARVLGSRRVPAAWLMRYEQNLDAIRAARRPADAADAAWPRTPLARNTHFAFSLESIDWYLGLLDGYEVEAQRWAAVQTLGRTDFVAPLIDQAKGGSTDTRRIRKGKAPARGSDEPEHSEDDSDAGESEADGSDAGEHKGKAEASADLQGGSVDGTGDEAPGNVPGEAADPAADQLAVRPAGCHCLTRWSGPVMIGVLRDVAPIAEHERLLSDFNAYLYSRGGATLRHMKDLSDASLAQATRNPATGRLLTLNGFTNRVRQARDEFARCASKCEYRFRILGDQSADGDFDGR
ncbi:MAG: hypothetical protein ACK5XM_14580 [Betaproteobacteria bacterium]